MKEMMLYYSLLHNGDWNKIKDSLVSSLDVDKLELNKLLKKLDANYITILDKEYPELLKKSIKPPFVIFYKGNIDNLNKNIYSLYFNSIIDLKDKNDTRNYLKKRFVDSYSMIALNYRNVTEIIKIHKKVLEDKVVLLSTSGLKYNRISSIESMIDKMDKDSNNLIITEIPFSIGSNSNTYVNSLRIMSSISKEVFMPKVLKNIESYKFLCHCIDNDTKISTIKNDNNNMIANNFLISQGAKDIKRKLN
ncbi:MAG: hypothetical protein HRS57_01685 [Mycoplasmataceae bacterium]|nr:hypothetical protein [Mycoplasmataceae bacterium]